MRICDVLPRGLEDTSIGAPLEGLHRIYERIGSDQDKWTSATPYRCPNGCGSCCEGFEPETLEVEALYLAAWLYRADGERFSAALEGYPESRAERPGCVLADPSGKYHCTVYGGRPLVCRLFAYSGDRAKDGSARFSLCSRMDDLGGPRRMDEKAILERFGLLPPVMGDLAGEAESLLPDSAGERSPLRSALPRAAAKIRYLADLAASSAFAVVRSESGGKGDGDNDNPGGGLPPMPRAG